MWALSDVSSWLDSSNQLLDYYRSAVSSGKHVQRDMRFCPSFVNRYNWKVVKTKIRILGFICCLCHTTFTALPLRLSFCICKKGISKQCTYLIRLLSKLNEFIFVVLKTDWLIINTVWVLAIIIDLESPNDVIITIILRSSVRKSFRNADMLHALF